ncbi:MAG: hypothetical protein KDA86_22355, partial [Planctomycetaceae bacterium]|nr:hypothetical protein [Planctomycetaceae bacterium]
QHHKPEGRTRKLSDPIGHLFSSCIIKAKSSGRMTNSAIYSVNHYTIRQVGLSFLTSEDTSILSLKPNDCLLFREQRPNHNLTSMLTDDIIDINIRISRQGPEQPT